MLTAIIVEDRQTNIDTLQQLLQQFCPSVQLLDTALDIESAYLQIGRLSPQLVFLDIELGNATGFDLLHMFRTPLFKTIFTTAYSHYAIDAFREQALDYLLKPISIPHLQQAVLKVEHQVAQEMEHQALRKQVQPHTKISLPTLEGFLFIDYNEILRCEAAGSYSVFHLLQGDKITVSMRLKECEELLPATVFYRVHNSHIVNVNHIRKYTRGRVGQLILNTNTVVEVSATRKDDFLKFMNRRWK